MKEAEYGHIRLAQLTGADEVTVTGHRYARMDAQKPGTWRPKSARYVLYQIWLSVFTATKGLATVCKLSSETIDYARRAGPLPLAEVAIRVSTLHSFGHYSRREANHNLPR